MEADPDSYVGLGQCSVLVPGEFRDCIVRLEEVWLHASMNIDQ